LRVNNASIVSTTPGGNNTVVLPGSDAAVLRIQGTEKAIALTTDAMAGIAF